MPTIIKCSRCNRRYRGSGDWNITAEHGAIVGHLCPDCQTPEENAEAEINMATLDYIGTDQLGRYVARSKSCS